MLRILAVEGNQRPDIICKMKDKSVHLVNPTAERSTTFPGPNKVLETAHSSLECVTPANIPSGTERGWLCVGGPGTEVSATGPGCCSDYSTSWTISSSKAVGTWSSLYHKESCAGPYCVLQSLYFGSRLYSDLYPNILRTNPGLLLHLTGNWTDSWPPSYRKTWADHHDVSPVTQEQQPTILSMSWGYKEFI